MEACGSEIVDWVAGGVAIIAAIYLLLTGRWPLPMNGEYSPETMRLMGLVVAAFGIALLLPGRFSEQVQQYTGLPLDWRCERHYDN